MSSRRGALHYFRDLSFGGLSEAHPGTTAVLASNFGNPCHSILKGSRVVFNIKGNDYRLIASIQYQAGVLAIRFFGTHAEYDKIDAESV